MSFSIDTIKKNANYDSLPFVSIMTPTYNRRPFFPMIIKCFLHQDYPPEKMEWIIIDDGTDLVEDLVAHIPRVKYFKYAEKMVLGRKRNYMHEKASGDIFVYMDDDDYYPPQRVSHAVERLMNSTAMCAGTNELHCYFNHIKKIYQFGPYGGIQATANTFAFKKEYIKENRYYDDAVLAEEKVFLKNFTVEMVLLDPRKTLLVFSHLHNTFDKKILIDNPDPFVHETDLTLEMFVQDQDLIKFFTQDMDKILSEYTIGSTQNKKDLDKEVNKVKLVQTIRNNPVGQIDPKHVLDIMLDYEISVQKINMKQYCLDNINKVLMEKNNFLTTQFRNIMNSIFLTERQTIRDNSLHLKKVIGDIFANNPFSTLDQFYNTFTNNMTDAVMMEEVKKTKDKKIEELNKFIAGNPMANINNIIMSYEEQTYKFSNNINTFINKNKNLTENNKILESKLLAAVNNFQKSFNVFHYIQ